MFSEGIALYRFICLPVGISSSPALFSRQIARVLAPLKREGWIHNYLDDVVLYVQNFDTLVTRLNKVFTCLADAGV